MKKVLVPAIALLMGSGALHGQSKNQFKYGLKEVSVAPFEKIRVNANVQVVLVPNKSVSRVFIEGEAQRLNAITVSTKDGELVIDAANNFSGKTNLLVTIPVDNIKLVSIKGEARIESLASL